MPMPGLNRPSFVLYLRRRQKVAELSVYHPVPKLACSGAKSPELLIADIPGLIEGAAEAPSGIRFLSTWAYSPTAHL